MSAPREDVVQPPVLRDSNRCGDVVRSSGWRLLTRLVLSAAGLRYASWNSSNSARSTTPSLFLSSWSNSLSASYLSISASHYNHISISNMRQLLLQLPVPGLCHGVFRALHWQTSLLQLYRSQHTPAGPELPWSSPTAPAQHTRLKPARIKCDSIHLQGCLKGLRQL